MMFNGKIYDQIKSGNFAFDHEKIREKSGNFISLSEWEPCTAHSERESVINFCDSDIKGCGDDIDVVRMIDRFIASEDE